MVKSIYLPMLIPTSHSDGTARIFYRFSLPSVLLFSVILTIYPYSTSSIINFTILNGILDQKSYIPLTTSKIKMQIRRKQIDLKRKKGGRSLSLDLILY